MNRTAHKLQRLSWGEFFLVRPIIQSDRLSGSLLALFDQ